MVLRLSRLTFRYESAPDPLFEGVTLDLPAGWTGIVGPNGSGKTTLLLLAAGRLGPTAGVVSGPEPALYCEQRTDEHPPGLAHLLASTEGGARRLAGRLALGDDWPARWSSLSHGERKRAQVAVALWHEPALLAIDEPTNHLDARAREMLADALAAYRGIGLLVSHDRELLDRLCARSLFVEPPGAVLRTGGYTQAAAAAAAERRAARERYELARGEADRLLAEAARRRAEAGRADRKRSKRGLAWKDSDGRGRIDAARATGKDGKAGRLLRQMQGRVAQAEQARDTTYARREQRLAFWLPGSRFPGRELLTLPAGDLHLGPVRRLEHPELRLGSAERRAIAGPNGAGKSTLVAALVAAWTRDPARLVYLPQEVPAQEGALLLAQARELPRERLGHLMTVVNDLGSEPERLLATETPTPGETRKLLLALGVVREPWLIVMDEPTNHLDLPTTELLEKALAECPCALLLVSHDRRFVDAVGCATWRVEPTAGGSRLVVG
jgi:macrolide transport system ATP-binding/permease protein